MIALKSSLKKNACREWQNKMAEQKCRKWMHWEILGAGANVDRLTEKKGVMSAGLGKQSQEVKGKEPSAAHLIQE